MPLRHRPAPPARHFQQQCQCLFLLFHHHRNTTTTYYHPHAPPSPHLRSSTRPFHSTPARRDEAIDNARNHYETLKLQPGATPAEIKKSFYTLSKTHHPDHNPSSRQTSSRRFMRISEAYSILSIPSKRASYDRDNQFFPSSSSSSSSSTSSSPRKGSYSSTNNPAGGRPASGLSRRRTTFRGPPPSFWRNGGWGSQEGKRRAAHEAGGEGGNDAQHNTQHQQQSSGGATGATGSTRNPYPGMNPGQSRYGHNEEVPHFDREGHERTGRHLHDYHHHVHHRRRRRKRGEDEDDEEGRGGFRGFVDGFGGSGGGGGGGGVEVGGGGGESGVAGMFFVIGGIIVLSALVVPFAIGRVLQGEGVGRPGSVKERKGKG
ncbi:DnaJ-domain-containing protein [Xylariomycetidae sp. FL2044]|nr:DnaJ-domain-containing protein [Xylariomycetidae sp. FL2044]